MCLWMSKQAGNFRVITMARVLKVSRSGFYRWRDRQQRPSPRQESRRRLDEAVKEAFESQKGRSGSPRLVLDLADAGHPHDRKTVASSLRRQGLQAPRPRRSSRPPQTPTIISQWRRTCWIRILPLQHQTRSTWVTSPTCGPMKAGYTWLP